MYGLTITTVSFSFRNDICGFKLQINNMIGFHPWYILSCIICLVGELLIYHVYFC